jgi:hypothetical protein
MRNAMVYILVLILASACNAQTMLKSEEIIKNLASGKSMKIKGVIIDGDLDFGKIDGMRINGNIYFEKCIFKGNVKAKDVYFNGNVVFLASEFQKDTDFQNVSVFGMVNFSKSIFKGKAIFANMAAWAKNSYFSEVKASGRFSLEASDFHGDLSIMDSEFFDVFSVQETFVLGNLQGSNAKFNGSTDFSMLSVLRRTIFKYATFKNEPDFSNSKIARE